MLQTFNTLVGIGIIITIITVLTIIALVFLGETDSKLFKFIKRHSLPFGFILAFAGVFGSLMYSEVFNFVPCIFCWWIRIFLYPQVAILGVALWYKDTRMWFSSIILSVIGLGFSIYLVLLQTGTIGPSAACSTLGVSCEKIDVTVFGWLTIPIMSLIFFIGILALSYIGLKKSHEKTA